MGFFSGSWLKSERRSHKEGPENCCLGSAAYQGDAAGESEVETDGSFVIECPGLGVVPKLVSALILNRSSYSASEPIHQVHTKTHLHQCV